ncbi:MAG: hypothetical protein ABIJ57_13805 [Pseudomonadota bacterium]
MKTLERYEEICLLYFNGNIPDFRKSLQGLSKKEILVLEFNLAARMGEIPDGRHWHEANNIIHRYL